jgi:hypothetical protein
MATPAARILQKRYNAGSCTLDVELQLSALSQWYPQPIAQALQFKLWMSSDAVGDRRQPLPASELIAQGDRAALQTLSQAVSQKVRSLLVIAHLNNSDERSQPSTPQPSAPQPAQPLPGLQLTQPLSYLQLCDISSVLYQCEQATPALPILLSDAVATQDQTQAQTQAQRASQTEIQSETQESPLSAVPGGRTDDSNAPRRNNVIPFAAIRRRPQLWASSAAAALLAVGLTTTLWPSIQPSSELATTNEPASSNPAGSDANNRLARPNALPRNADNTLPQTRDSVAPAPANAPTAQKAPDGEAAPNAPAATNSPATNSPTTANSVESATAPSTNAARSSEGAAEGENTAKQPDTVAATSPTNEPGAAATAQPAPNSPAPAVPPPAADAPQSVARYGTSPESTQNSAAESFGTDQSALSATSEGVVGTAQMDGQATVQQASLTVEQVQNYFQARWQQTKPAALSDTLSYKIQLSETGEVISFVGLSEAAQQYRSSLLPAGRALVFPVDSPLGSPEQGAGLTLQLNLLPDGQAQVVQ